ncbi:MAG: hypothetical protein CL920_33970 [Deltaproteobacteria bacterium]|nr:hypothetical protein [Deltaproteobacteria bacterium]MBU53730.1 hypothetical protein [Deltaproteobacteria bacterium]|tara:strand:+ start:10321 stop:10938 length:618 start_codon:yes stop_codon:yes gene_type:complete
MDIGSIIKAPMEDSDWIKKCALIGLMMLVPIVGVFNLLGWAVECFEVRRNGGRELPPANFSYLGKGFSLFLSFLPIYIVFIVAVVGLGFVIKMVLGGGEMTPQKLQMVATLTSAVMGICGLAMYIAIPAIWYVHLAEGRSWASAQVGSIIRVITKNVGNYFMLVLIFFLAGIIAQLGVIACGVGLLITSPLSMAIMSYATADFRA